MRVASDRLERSGDGGQKHAIGGAGAGRIVDRVGADVTTARRVIAEMTKEGIAMTFGPTTVVPCLSYRDPRKAADWLRDAFGFEIKEMITDDDGAVVHAEAVYGNGMLMFGGHGDGETAGRAGSGYLYVVVEDVDAHHARAKAAGAEIVRELTDKDYGSRDYTARDLDGNMWTFGTYRTALAAAE